jgi:hypothetical protein
MFLDVENAEDFIKLLEAENDKKIPIFIGQMTQYMQNGIATTQIVIQYQYDHSMIVRFKDTVGNVWIPRDSNDTVAVSMTEDINKKAEEKKASIFQLLVNRGFENIIKGTWMGS